MDGCDVGVRFWAGSAVEAEKRRPLRAEESGLRVPRG